MAYLFPFGQEVHPLVQEDQTPKKVFVLGVYSSAVHAKWKDTNGRIVVRALAVASEPRIFWDGDPDEAREIISRIHIPPECGTLEPADQQHNGPSAKSLNEDILAPLGFTRRDAWLCDLLPETRINPNQLAALQNKYEPLRAKFGLNEVTVPLCPKAFCDAARAEEITDELMRSEAELLVLLGKDPIEQYLKRVADVPYRSLRDYVERFGYGQATDVTIRGKTLKVLPLTHPRQIRGMGRHDETWHDLHRDWMSGR